MVTSFFGSAQFADAKAHAYLSPSHASIHTLTWSLRHQKAEAVVGRSALGTMRSSSGASGAAGGTVSRRLEVLSRQVAVEAASATEGGPALSRQACAGAVKSLPRFDAHILETYMDDQRELKQKVGNRHACARGLLRKCRLPAYLPSAQPLPLSHPAAQAYDLFRQRPDLLPSEAEGLSKGVCWLGHCLATTSTWAKPVRAHTCHARSSYACRGAPLSGQAPAARHPGLRLLTAGALLKGHEKVSAGPPASFFLFACASHPPLLTLRRASTQHPIPSPMGCTRRYFFLGECLSLVDLSLMVKSGVQYSLWGGR
jgi:hypothetical protein